MGFLDWFKRKEKGVTIEEIRNHPHKRWRYLSDNETKVWV